MVTTKPFSKDHGQNATGQAPWKIVAFSNIFGLGTAGGPILKTPPTPTSKHHKGLPADSSRECPRTPGCSRPAGCRSSAAGNTCIGLPGQRKSRTGKAPRNRMRPRIPVLRCKSPRSPRGPSSARSSGTSTEPRFRPPAAGRGCIAPGGRSSGAGGQTRQRRTRPGGEP